MENKTNTTVTKDGEIKAIIFTKPKNGRFFKQLEARPKFAGSPTGDGWEHVIEYKIDPLTGESVAKANNVHLWALIQESECTCNLDYVIGEMSKGNMDVLEKTDGKFMDITKMPKDIYELQAFEQKTNEYYAKDPYIKRLYKTAGDYRKALSSGVDIEKQIIDLYRKDMFEMKLASMKKNGADAPKEGK